MTNSAAYRLRKELSALEKEPIENVKAKIVDGNILHWRAILIGPSGTPYEGGKYEVELNFRSSYPFDPPSLRFLTPIFHPNIGEQGKVCIDILGRQWSPVMTVSSILISLVSFLGDPNIYNPLDAFAASLYMDDKEQYNQKVKEMKEAYAK